MGFLYARHEVQHLLKPLVVLWEHESEFSSGSKLSNNHKWWGTRDMTAFLAVPSAIQFQKESKWDEVRESPHQIAVYAQNRICELTGLAPLHPQADDWLCRLITAPLPADTDIIIIKERFFNDYRVEIPLIDCNGNKLIRVSVLGYNTKRDINTLTNVLSVLLEKDELI